MEGNCLKLVYVDDRIDPSLSRYLDEYCSYYSGEQNLLYQEVTFSPEDNYEVLLGNYAVRTANVLLIDSRLFEEANVTEEKFTGEEFRVILGKLFPYIEVIVISQNVLDIEWSCVEKCKGNRTYEEAKTHYDQVLKGIIEQKLQIVCETRRLIDRLEARDSIDKVLIEKIRNIADGTSEYDELKASDIDYIIQTFNELIKRG